MTEHGVVTAACDILIGRIPRNAPARVGCGTRRRDELILAGRGTLNGAKDALTATVFRQGWDLTGVGSPDSSGARTHNKVNEITGIDGEDDHVAHDARGDLPAPTRLRQGLGGQRLRQAGMAPIPKPGDEANRHHAATYDAWNRLVRTLIDSNTGPGEFC